MKILITTDLFTTETNGVVTSTKNLWDELEKAGHEVRILTVAENTHSRKEGNVYFIRSLPLGAIYPDVRMPTSYHHKLIKELIAWNPDIIHSQCEFFSFQFAHYVAKKTGTPIVHTYHTLYEQYVSYVLHMKGVGEKAVGKLSKMRLKNVQMIIAPTTKVENTLRAYGITVPIRVIPSGIRLDRHKLRLTSEERQESRKKWGIGPEQKVLLNLGRLGTEKNIDELIRYFARAREQLPYDMKFLIVGGGPAKESLEKLAESLNLSQDVIFTGMVAPEDVAKYYQLGDVFVGASTSETQGLTYVEASANALPLLCRQDPCLDDVMLPGENGYTYTDEADFCRHLGEIFADENWLENAGKRSEQIALGYSKEAFGEAVQDAYQQVLQNWVCEPEPMEV